MRMSTMFGRTLREAPSDVEVASHGLLLRAGFIRQLAAGIFSYLPLAKRSIGKIEKILREEIVAGLAASEVDSYQRLPRLVYQIQTKFRDDARPRAGLIRAREFTMKDAYSLDRDEEGLERQYRTVHDAYFRIFGRCGLPTVAVGADVGVMGGSMAHEFMYLSPVGEDTILICDGCGYTANRQVARLRKPLAEPEEMKPVEKIATPAA